MATPQITVRVRKSDLTLQSHILCWVQPYVILPESGFVAQTAMDNADLMMFSEGPPVQVPSTSAVDLILPFSTSAVYGIRSSHGPDVVLNLTQGGYASGSTVQYGSLPPLQTSPGTYTAPSSMYVDGIQDATLLGKSILKANTAADARTLIGAGTSNLTIGATSTTAKAGNYVPTWGEITGKPITFTPATHAATHAAGGSDAVTLTSAQLSDLTETVQDIVAAMISAGTGITVSYNDAAGTFTINSSSMTTDPEVVRDVIGAAMVAGAGVQITVNDAGDTITVTSTAVLPTRQVIAGTGLNGGGDLSADRTLTVLYGTAAGTAAQGNDSRITGAVQSTRQVIAGTGLNGGGALSADRTLSVAYGTTAGTAAQGNDARITAAAAGRYAGVNAQTGTTYTAVLTDEGKLVTLTNAAAVTVTLPTDATAAIPVGGRVDFAVMGTGMATFVAAAGATAVGTPTLVTRAQYSTVSAIKTAANAWLVVGDLAG